MTSYSPVRQRASAQDPFADHADESSFPPSQQFQFGGLSTGVSGAARSSRLSKHKRNKWILGGSALFVAVVLASVLGGVLGSRGGNDQDSASDNVRTAGDRAAVVEDPAQIAPADVIYGYPGDSVISE